MIPLVYRVIQGRTLLISYCVRYLWFILLCFSPWVPLTYSSVMGCPYEHTTDAQEKMRNTDENEGLRFYFTISLLCY